MAQRAQQAFCAWAASCLMFTSALNSVIAQARPQGQTLLSKIRLAVDIRDIFDYG